MPRAKRKMRGAQKRLAAAINVTALGLVLLLVPHFLDSSVFAAAFRPLATIGWLLLIGGAGAVVWLLRAKTGIPVADAPARQTPGPSKPARRPAKGVPLIERLAPGQAATTAAVANEQALFERVRPSAWGPNVLGAIEWRRFEALVEALFAQAGFLTKAESHGPDDGVDVWLYSKTQPDGAPVSVVQCKHWQGKRVGVDKVRELRGVMADKGVTRGQFAATAGFTPDAIAFAAGNGIKLHDGAGLLELIAKRSSKQQRDLLDVALEGEYWRPTCASCGIKLIEREPSAGGTPFWGCANFPKCRTTMARSTTRSRGNRFASTDEA